MSSNGADGPAALKNDFSGTVHSFEEGSCSYLARTQDRQFFWEIGVSWENLDGSPRATPGLVADVCPGATRNPHWRQGSRLTPKTRACSLVDLRCQAYLTECIYELVLESQIPQNHQIIVYYY